MKQVNHMAIDSGYDYMKILSELRTGSYEIKTERFPALREEQKSEQVEGEDTSRFKKEKMRIKYNNTKYKIGDYVFLSSTTGGVGTRQMNRNLERFKSNKEIAAILSAVQLMHPNASYVMIKNIAFGLPLSLFNQGNREELEEFYSGKDLTCKIPTGRTFKEKEVVLKNASVYPQGLASYYNLIMEVKGNQIIPVNKEKLDIPQEMIEGRFIGILDFGGNTFDGIIFNTDLYELVPGSDISNNKGIINIFEEVGKELGGLSEVQVQKLYLGRSETEVGKNRSVKAGEAKELVNDYLATRASELFDELTISWSEDIDQLAGVVFTGGAAKSYYQHMEDKFNNLGAGIPNALASQPQMSNVYGLYKMLRIRNNS